VIYLLRHGDAEDGAGDDAARRLTAKVRAVETARLACEALGVEVEVTEALRGGPFDALNLVAGRGDVLLVGHEPDFSMEVGRLTGANVAMKKGGIAVVDGSTLMALLRPKELSRIAG
jgi:phosphohistidine phosphatase